MNFNPSIHHRHSIRIQGYDYSRDALYFITICTKNRRPLFGNIENGKMILNPGGIIADQCWDEIPKHYPNAILHAHVIMPDHIHGIIEIKSESTSNINHDIESTPVGAQNFEPLPIRTISPIPPASSPIPPSSSFIIPAASSSIIPAALSSIPPASSSTQFGSTNRSPVHGHKNEYQKIIPRSIGAIIRGYKTGVTVWFRANISIRDIWQRNYYETIIRNDHAFENITRYIIANPSAWHKNTLRLD